MGSQELQSYAQIIGGIAAVLGGLVGAFATGFLNPYLCFSIYGAFGLVVLWSGLQMDMKLEVQNDFELEQAMRLNGQNLGRRRKFSEELTHNWHVVRNGLKQPQYMRLVLFYVLWGLTVPRYDEFMYYFQLDILGFSQFQYALLSLIGAIFMLIGSIVYSKCLKRFESRNLIGFASFVHILGSFSSLAFVLRWNLRMGISDIVFAFCTSSTLMPLQYALFILPPYILVAKLTPSHVEATVFSFSAGLINGCIFMLSRFVGNFYNILFFGVTADNLEDLWQLYILEILFVAISYGYLGLIPTWKQVSIAQAHIKELNESEESDSLSSENANQNE